MVSKLGQFTKPGPLSTFQLFLNCPNFITIFFCRVLKVKMIFVLNVTKNCPPFAYRNSLTNNCYQTNYVSGNFQKEKKNVTSLNRDIHPGYS